MKKTMRLWQMIVGCIILAGLITTLFMPRIRVSADAFVDWMVDLFLESDFATQYGITVDDETRSKLSEGLSDAMNEEFGTDAFSVSSLWIITETEGKLTEDLEDADMLYGADEENVRDKIHETCQEILPLQIMMVILYILPVVMIVLLIIGFVKRWRSIISLIISWIYIIGAGILQFVWLSVIPQKIATVIYVSMASSIKHVMGWDASFKEYFFDAAAEYLEPTFTDGLTELFQRYTGMGTYVMIGLLIALLVWTVLVLIFSKVDGTVVVSGQEMLMTGSNGMPDQMGIMPGQVVGGQMGAMPGNMPEQIPIAAGAMPGQIPAPDPAAAALPANDHPGIPMGPGNGMSGNQPDQRGGMVSGMQGQINGIRGSLAGASLTIQPGEQFVVGRNPAAAQLIIDREFISPRHCAIQFDPSGQLYQVCSYAGDGQVGYSGSLQGQIAGMQAGAVYQIPKGAVLYFGGNEEVLQLN